jgi:hypothetical protein
MKVDIVLADKGSANPQAGTLNLLNVGWSVTTLNPGQAGAEPMTPPHAVAIFFEVELHRCNQPLQMVVELLTEDGQTVQVHTPNGDQPLHIEQTVTVSPPAGAPIGSPGHGNTLIEMAPGLPLPPGTYRWEVSLDRERKTEWTASFHVRPPQQQPVIGFGE